MVKKTINKHPYVLPFAVGIILFLASLPFNGKLSDLLVNLSASLVIIPAVIFLYEKVREKAEAEKNRDLSDYVKMQADRELLTLLNRISPLVIGSPTPGLNKVLKLLSMTQEKMLKNLETHTIMVFYLATDWLQSENAIRELVSSELTYNNLSVDARYYMASGKPDTKYNVINGKELNDANKFDNRYLLMTKTKKSDRFVVAAFNDINIGKYSFDLTTPMKINNDGKKLLVEAISEVFECIEKWHKYRGNVFLLDTHHFKSFRSSQKRAK
jgi:hypothetical protein